MVTNSGFAVQLLPADSARVPLHPEASAFIGQQSTRTLSNPAEGFGIRMATRIQVMLFRARNLAAKDSNGLSDPFARLQLGKSKAKSATIYKNLNPVWNEEFVFKVDDVQNDILQISLWDEDFFGMADFLGQISIKVADLAAEEGSCIPRRWYTLLQKTEKSRQLISGEVELSLSLSGAVPRSSSTTTAIFPSVTIGKEITANHVPPESSLEHGDFSFGGVKSEPEEAGNLSDRSNRSTSESIILPSTAPSIERSGSGASTLSWSSSLNELPNEPTLKELPPQGKPFPQMNSIRAASTDLFSKLKKTATKGTRASNSLSGPLNDVAKLIKNRSVAFPVAASAPGGHSESIWEDAPPRPLTSEALGDAPQPLPAAWFDKCLKDIQSAGEMPPPMDGGVVLDQDFACPAHELNSIIFRNESDFWLEFATLRKLTQLEVKHWQEDHTGNHKRTVTYMTAPSALVKSVKATEEMSYTRSDAEGYVVEVEVATPDVPYGNTFVTQMQFCITSRADGGCHLRVSYRPNFLQSTMMKSMIENGMRTGIKETYIAYLQTLSKYAAPSGSSPDQPAAASGAPAGPKTWRERALQLLVPASFIVVALSIELLLLHFYSLFMGGQGLQLWLVDLPDSLSELATTAIMTLAAYKVLHQAKVYAGTRLYSKGDAGKKATGEGWVLSITLVEGESIGGPGIRDLADPFVVFTCNGKSRRSSVRLAKRNPSWNEVFEFDAFEDIPSMMDVELFDYEGPFTEADLLGQSEVNFLTQSEQELADLWLDLEGRKAKLHGSRLHLRVQLTQTSEGKKKVVEMVERIRREATGQRKKKPKVASNEKTVAFQKLFDLQEHDLLVSDYSCALKKGILLQGRLFLAPRVLCFHSNIFGKKTRFILLWEDIEELRCNVPTINSINRLLNPSMTLYLKRDRRVQNIKDAAYGLDQEGRPKVRFQSFVRSAEAFRIIQLLWENRALSPEQQLLKVQEAQATGQLVTTDSGTSDTGADDDSSIYLGTEAPEVLVAMEHDVPISIEQFLTVLKEKNLMQKIAEALGQLNLEASDWVAIDNGHERNLKYTLSRQQSPFGSDVSVIQKTVRDAKEPPLWVEMEEAITLHNVPFGDHFQVNLTRRTSQKIVSLCVVKATVSIVWLKETPAETKDKIKKDVSTYYKEQFGITRGVIVREMVCATQ